MTLTSALSFSFLFRSRLSSYCQLESIPAHKAVVGSAAGAGADPDPDADADVVEGTEVESTTSVALPVRRTLTALELGARTDRSELGTLAVELEVEVEGPTLER